MKAVNVKNVSINDLAFKSLKWSDLFETEEQLMLCLLLTDFRHHITCKGYEFFESVQAYYIKNKTLTPKQITQLKRGAKNIYWLYRFQRDESYGYCGTLMATRIS